MKKLMVGLMVAVLLLGAVPTTQAQGRGGIGGFFVGCCFGVRTAGQWNEGKDLHWREWCRLIPYVGVVFAVWDSIEGAQGKTTSSLANEYGSNFY